MKPPTILAVFFLFFLSVGQKDGCQRSVCSCHPFYKWHRCFIFNTLCNDRNILEGVSVNGLRLMEMRVDNGCFLAADDFCKFLNSSLFDAFHRLQFLLQQVAALRPDAADVIELGV